MGHISAKVLNVFNKGAIALNAGKTKGITKKMKFSVLRDKRVVARMVVTEAYDSFSIAERIDNLVSGEQSESIIAVGLDVVSE